MCEGVEMNITSNHVKAFWAFMSNKYGTTAKSKADADEMKVVSKVLGTLGVVDQDAFMARFTTTIGKTIYIPFTIGEATENWSLWGQIQVCAHEHQHVIQSIEAGEAMFFARYLLDPTYRAVYEAEGYRTNMALNWWATKVPPDIAPYLKSIKSYGIDQPNVDFFERTLTMSAPIIQEGGVPDEAARVAIEWLEANG